MAESLMAKSLMDESLADTGQYIFRDETVPGRQRRCFSHAENGRGERIRTSGPRLPKTVLYQAELLPDRSFGQEAVRASGL